MRLLFVLENFYPNIGGVETLFKSLTEALAAQGHHVTVFTNKFSDTLKTEETIDNVHIVRVNLKNRYLFTFFSIFKLLPYAREADLIHTTSYNAGVPAYLAGKLTGIKTIITFHEVWGALWTKLPYINFLSARMHRLFEWFLLKLNFTKFIAVSDFTKKQLQLHGIRKDKLQRIYNGIDYNTFDISTDSLPPNKKYTFTYFGRLGISKGLNLLMDAAESLKQDGKDFILQLIIPTEPKFFYRMIKNQINAKDLMDTVVVKSHLKKDDLLQNIRSSDCVIIPSYSEGFCFSAVETMALNVPIISSGQGALKEVVSGSYLEMSDLTSESLYHCMKLAMSDQWKRKEIKKFHLRDSVEQYITCYQEILNTDV